MATMMESSAPVWRARVVGVEVLDDLIRVLVQEGYEVVGPKAEDGAICYAPIGSAAELPVGLADEQAGGRYRLVEAGRPSLFDYVVGPHSPKRFLFPSTQRLWSARRDGQGFIVEAEVSEARRYAFIGVRACEIAAMTVQDRVFDNGDFADPLYLDRRNGAFIVAVNCARPAGTCFCASMGTGPKASGGFDLALTEVIEADRHEFILEPGSERGAAVLEQLSGRDAEEPDRAVAEKITAQATEAMKRAMVPDVAELLQRNLAHPHWDEVAQRCLACGNCTAVCPTCFCSNVLDTTDLSGETAERWRYWDSCFNSDFSYIHGGHVRGSTAARYRQWITHKLSTWHQQFGTSGCVGCGRCITWCPVGIDITEEVRVIRDGEEGD